jgi:hypothetical protein
MSWRSPPGGPCWECLFPVAILVVCLLWFFANVR